MMTSKLILLVSLAAFVNGATIPDGAPHETKAESDKHIVDVRPIDDDNPVEIDPLGLSSFEMYMLTDLLVEITTRPCNAVNRPVMSSIKKFLFTGLAPAPTHESQHPAFFDTYKNLVDCLTVADETFSGYKTLASAFFPGEEPNSRTKRDATTADQVAPPEKDNFLAKTTPVLEHELSIVNPNLSFEKFFVLMLSIVRKTCPAGLRPNLDFMVPAMNDILWWLADNPTLYKAAQLKYFHNTEIIHELGKCEEEIDSAISKQNEDMDFDVLE